jgi:aminoglycoside 3-N-acetyltransferase I
MLCVGLPTTPCMMVKRLGVADASVAAATFALMASVFAEDEGGHDSPMPATPLTHVDVTELLGRRSFWAVAAIDDDDVVGGLTAHVLPMTRNKSCELFIYDLAVRQDRQRQGIGRALVEEVLRLARSADIATTFVLADNDDGHALDFYRAVGAAMSPVTLFAFGD